MTTAQLDLFTPVIAVQVADTWGTAIGPWHYWTYNDKTGLYDAACDDRVHSRVGDLFKSQQFKPAKPCPRCIVIVTKENV